MKCPKCRQGRALDDRICRRCKYVFDEDRFIGLAPPRAADRPLRERLLSPAVRRRFADWKPVVGMFVVASLIPGLGHLIARRFWTGMAFLVLVLALGSWSIRSFSETSGRLLFGTMISAHSFCILDMTPWGKAPDAMRRGIAMGAILGILFCLYWPLFVRMANLFVRPENVQRERSFWPEVRGVSAGQVVVMILLFALSIAVSSWMRRRLQSRGP